MNMISNISLSPGDVIDAYVYYEDAPNVGKKRPVLVINPEKLYVVALKMTSHPPRSSYQGEYQVADFAHAGLKKPTTVRISKVLKIEYKNIVSYRRRLSDFDQNPSCADSIFWKMAIAGYIR